MTPKFIEVTTFGGNGTKVMVNPRRLNSFSVRPRPTQQPELDCGTYLSFGRGEFLVVKETVAEIKTLLSK